MSRVRAQSHIAALTETHRLLMQRIATQRRRYADPLDPRTLRCERVVRMLDTRIRLTAMQLVEDDARFDASAPSGDAPRSLPHARERVE